MQVLSMLFVISACLMAVIHGYRFLFTEHALTRIQIQSCLVATLCLLGTHFFYIEAFKYADPLFADLVTYLWPVYLFLMMSITQARSVQRREWMGLLIATVGICVLFWPSTHTPNMNQPQQYLGILAAFGAGLC